MTTNGEVRVVRGSQPGNQWVRPVGGGITPSVVKLRGHGEAQYLLAAVKTYGLRKNGEEDRPYSLIAAGFFSLLGYDHVHDCYPLNWSHELQESQFVFEPAFQQDATIPGDDALREPSPSVSDPLSDPSKPPYSIVSPSLLKLPDDTLVMFYTRGEGADDTSVKLETFSQRFRTFDGGRWNDSSPVCNVWGGTANDCAAILKQHGPHQGRILTATCGNQAADPYWNLHFTDDLLEWEHYSGSDSSLEFPKVAALETALVEYYDGTTGLLFAFSRVSATRMKWQLSADGGDTWGEPKDLLDIAPGPPCIKAFRPPAGSEDRLLACFQTVSNQYRTGVLKFNGTDFEYEIGPKLPPFDPSTCYMPSMLIDPEEELVLIFGGRIPLGPLVYVVKPLAWFLS